MSNLIIENKVYYEQMLSKGRLIPFHVGEKLACFLTFYIGNSGSEYKFVREDMWEVLDDNPDGSVCYVDQLLTSKDKDNPRVSYEIWRRFKQYIRHNFKNVRVIRWNRFKDGKVTVYQKEIR